MVINSSPAGFRSTAMLANSSNSPLLCICSANGPGRPAAGSVNAQYLQGGAADRLRDRHPRRASCRFDEDLDATPIDVRRTVA